MNWLVKVKQHVTDKLVSAATTEHISNPCHDDSALRHSVTVLENVKAILGYREGRVIVIWVWENGLHRLYIRTI